MIGLFIRFIVVAFTALFYAAVAVTMAEVKLLRLGWAAITRRDTMTSEQLVGHSAAGVAGIALPIVIIVLIATAGSGSTAAPITSTPTQIAATRVHTPRTAKLETHRHHHAKKIAPRPKPHHKHGSRGLPAWLTGKHHHQASSAPTAHSCTLTNEGTCIRGGEFCRDSDEGTYGYDASGDRYYCTDGHWETP